MIEVEHLSKTYGGPRWAVRDVSFRVARGEVVGFLGPNGAGKSTTLRIVAGFLGATEGKVRIDGHDIVDEPLEARAKVGYMPEASPLYPEMRVAEYLAFRAELKGVKRADRKAWVERAMEQAKVADMAATLVSHLSKGYRQRVGLADALVGRPPILILDEPTAGLDPNQIREVRSLVRELGKEHAVLVSTHILPEVEATCDRALVIAKGKLVAEGTIDELRTLRRSNGVRVRVAKGADLAAASSLLAALQDVAKVRREEGALVALWKKTVEDTDRAVESIAAAIVGAGLGLRELQPLRASLEEVFTELTTEAPADGADEADEAPARAAGGAA
jgi:ABC-2 type transport system ATP-binding protein